MQLPNKLYSYKNSTLSLLPIVMRELQQAPVPVMELYERVRPALNDPTDFLSVMDCLYTLGAADINENKEVYKC